MTNLATQRYPKYAIPKRLNKTELAKIIGKFNNLKHLLLQFDLTESQLVDFFENLRCSAPSITINFEQSRYMEKEFKALISFLENHRNLRRFEVDWNKKGQFYQIEQLTQVLQKHKELEVFISKSTEDSTPARFRDLSITQELSKLPNLKVLELEYDNKEPLSAKNIEQLLNGMKKMKSLD